SLARNRCILSFVYISVYGIHIDFCFVCHTQTGKVVSPYFQPAKPFARTDWVGVFVWMFSASKRPRRYYGKATYVWASDDSFRRKAWPKIAEAKEAEVHFMPDVHFSLVTGQLGVVSKQL